MRLRRTSKRRSAAERSREETLVRGAGLDAGDAPCRSGFSAEVALAIDEEAAGCALSFSGAGCGSGGQGCGDRDALQDHAGNAYQLSCAEREGFDPNAVEGRAGRGREDGRGGVSGGIGICDCGDAQGQAECVYGRVCGAGAYSRGGGAASAAGLAALPGMRCERVLSAARSSGGGGCNCALVSSSQSFRLSLRYAWWRRDG